MLQEMRIGPPASDIIRRMNLERLNEVGLVPTEELINRAWQTVQHMSAEERSRAAGFYFIRDHDAIWFFSDRAQYFDSSAE
jgi:hypothetical protein